VWTRPEHGGDDQAGAAELDAALIREPLTELERALLEALLAGPQTPTELALSSGRSPAGRVLARLEHFGLARMVGSNDDGPWMLTAAGRLRVAAGVD